MLACFSRFQKSLWIPLVLLVNAGKLVAGRENVFKYVCAAVGIGEPAYFYIEAAFLLNGILLGVQFVFGTYLRLIFLFYATHHRNIF